MNNLKAGFGRANINPPMGIHVRGYYQERLADGILDDLEVNALAIEAGGKKVALVSLDNCGVNKEITDLFKKYAAEKTGLPESAIFVASTHTHTGPQVVNPDNPVDEAHGYDMDILEKEYTQFAIRRTADAIQFALDDLKPAKMGWGVGEAKNVAFVRRFRMKDGSIQTNPGVNNPDIVAPIGDIDERVNVLRFDREGAESLVLVNVGNHPDVVGGCKISADWPGFLRRTVEKSIDNTKCIFFNGAQGDINHVNVHPKGGDLNGMFMDFDDVSRGYAHSRHIGNVVAAGVLQVYEKVQYVDIDDIKFKEQEIKIPSNKADEKDLPEARRIDALHKAGKDAELPYKGMMLTTVVAEAARMLRLENGPDFFNMNLLGVSLGPVGIVGIPGEPFNGIGLGLKETEGYDVILPVCCANGSDGYFPMQEAYDEGGYESRSSIFKAGVAELIIDEGQKLLKELK